MKTIVVKTQAELDTLPDSFAEFTVIEISSKAALWIKVTKARGNSSVEARDNSSVVAWDNSSVVAWDNSSVEARDNSSVVAWDNSSVEARDNSSVEAGGNSSVEAWGNSSVEAWGNSSVEAWDNSSVVAWDNSSVEARGNSSVEARGNSSVEARDNSSVEAYDFSMIAVLSGLVLIKKLADYSVAALRGVKIKIKKKSSTATVVKTPMRIERSFKEWLIQGYVHADGLTKKLISTKKIKDIEIFTVEESMGKKPASFVVKRGNVFSHGETVEKAVEGLRYKLATHDVSKFKKWKPTDTKSVSDLIVAYRTITGACEFGTRQFVEGKKLPEKMTIQEVIELTKESYGSEKFAAFFKVRGRKS